MGGPSNRTPSSRAGYQLRSQSRPASRTWKGSPGLMTAMVVVAVRMHPAEARGQSLAGSIGEDGKQDGGDGRVGHRVEGQRGNRVSSASGPGSSNRSLRR